MWCKHSLEVPQQGPSNEHSNHGEKYQYLFVKKSALSDFTDIVTRRLEIFLYTPQPLYNTVVGVHSLNRVN